MNIALDSNILRRDRKLESYDILLLKKLSKLGLITIHIPWIVYKEETSHNFIETSELIAKMSRELENFDKKGLSFKESLALKKIAKQLDLVDLKKSVEDHWNNFFNESKAILHPFDSSYGEIVMLSYFHGEKPFPVAKSRKDIPDAFIYQSLKTILKSHSPITLVSGDNNLRKACNLLEDVNAISSFSELYGLEEYKPIEKKFKEIEHYVDELIVVEEGLSEIKREAIDRIHGDIFQDMVIDSENIPDDMHQGTVEEVPEITTLNIDKSQIKFIDDNFYIPISGTGRFTLQYFLFKSDYYLFESRNIRMIDADWNKHYFNVVEDFSFEFEFKFKLKKEDVEIMRNMEVEDLQVSNVEVIRKE
jgi:hypothetical protein